MIFKAKFSCHITMKIHPSTAVSSNMTDIHTAAIINTGHVLCVAAYATDDCMYAGYIL